MQPGTDKPYEQGEESKVIEDRQREDTVDHSNMPETPESSNTTPSQQVPPPVQQQQQQQHATWQHQPHALHMLSKFATIHGGDKYHQDLRRDLLTNFDRNLTVETAHFEPQAHSSAGPTNASSSSASMRRGPISYQGGIGSSSISVSKARIPYVSFYFQFYKLNEIRAIGRKPTQKKDDALLPLAVQPVLLKFFIDI